MWNGCVKPTTPVCCAQKYDMMAPHLVLQSYSVSRALPSFVMFPSVQMCMHFFFLSPLGPTYVFIPVDDDEKLVMKSERLLCEEMISALQKLCQQKEPPSDLKK